MAASSTSNVPPAATNQTNNNNPTNSPLLFFVALGFGVVFTNLWIIVGVKYCFRYNQRNRQLRNGEDGELIEVGAVPRAHRRRREKKLMTMEEVNERFPITKYKQWRSTRAKEGLPTAGGITAPPSRAASLKDEMGVVQPVQQPLATSKIDAESSKEVGASPSSPGPLSNNETMEKDLAVQAPPAQPSTNTASTTNTQVMTTSPHKDSMADDDDELEDAEQIQPTVPAEHLPNPGDTCAICLDIIEADDDIRGLTCGHAFHASCVDPWLTSRKACCPLCKADYYVAKPRNENSENDDASRTRGRANMPAPPPFTFLAGVGRRGSAPETISPAGDRMAGATRTRMVLPGRRMHIVYAGDDVHGYGFPQVVRASRADGREQSRRWPGFRRAPNASGAVIYGTDGANDIQPEIEHGQHRPTSTWRERIWSMPRIRIPRPGAGSRSIAPGTGSEAQNPQEQPLQDMTPRQLEAGVAMTNQDAGRRSD